MPTIEYKFNLDQRVSTVLGDQGVITTLGFQGHKNQYWIQMKDGRGAWFNEDQLMPLDTSN